MSGGAAVCEDWDPKVRELQIRDPSRHIPVRTRIRNSISGLMVVGTGQSLERHKRGRDGRQGLLALLQAGAGGRERGLPGDPRGNSLG